LAEGYRLKPGPKPIIATEEAENAFSKWWLDKGCAHFHVGEKEIVREAFLAGYKAKHE